MNSRERIRELMLERERKLACVVWSQCLRHLRLILLRRMLHKCCTSRLVSRKSFQDPDIQDVTTWKIFVTLLRIAADQQHWDIEDRHALPGTPSISSKMRFLY